MNASNPRKHGGYTIVGGGAIGGTLAWHLSRAGHGVTIVDTDPEHVAAINAKGLILERNGQRSAQNVTAIPPGEVHAPLHRVLLAVKAHATDTAAAWAAPRLAPEGFIVSVQNGLNEDVIAAHVGRERTVGCFVDLFADVIEPGVISDGGQGAMAVGELDGTISERVRQVVTDLQAWGPAQTTANLHGFLWAKLAFGAMLTATALADAPMAELLDRHRVAVHAVAAEITGLADRLGIRLEPFDAFEPEHYLPGAAPAGREAATDRLIAWLSTQAKNRSGIWRDIAVRHRPTEVPSQYRPVLGLAAAHGIDATVLAALLDQLAEVEADPSTMSEERLTHLDTLAQGAAA
jgi:2-dehydropantoate 2-reductase